MGAWAVVARSAISPTSFCSNVPRAGRYAERSTGRDDPAQREAVCRAVRDHVSEAVGINTERLAERKRVRGCSQICREEEIVEQLRDLTGPQRSKVNNRIRVHREDGTDAFEVFVAAAHHHQKAALGCGDATATDGSVNDGDSSSSRYFPEFATGIRVNRAVHGNDSTWLHAREDAVLTRDNVENIGVAADADAHEIACRA